MSWLPMRFVPSPGVDDVVLCMYIYVCVFGVEGWMDAKDEISCEHASSAADTHGGEKNTLKSEMHSFSFGVFLVCVSSSCGSH